MTHIVLVAAAAGPRSAIIPPLVAGLCVMRQTNPAVYRKAREQGLTWEEAHEFLQPTEGQGVQNDRDLDWWKFCTGEEIAQEDAQDYHRYVARYHLGNREKIIPLMAEYIEELVQHEAPQEEP